MIELAILVALFFASIWLFVIGMRDVYLMAAAILLWALIGGVVATPMSERWKEDVRRHLVRTGGE